MEVVIARFGEAVARAGASGGLATNAQRAAVNQALEEAGVGVQSLEPQWLPLPGGNGVHTLVFFATESDDGLRTADVDDAGDYRLLVPALELRHVRVVADAFRFVLGLFVAPLQDEQLEALRRAEERWRGYLFEGYSQYPWEALFNGWVLDYDTFEPPRSQWILAHPSLAFEASTVSLDEVQADEVLAVELVGYLRYYDDNHEYVGAALTATLHDSLSPGIGLLAHWSNRISLGVTWHDLDDDDHYFDEDPYLLLSIDLFGYAQTHGPVFREKYDFVRGLLGR